MVQSSMPNGAATSTMAVADSLVKAATVPPYTSKSKEEQLEYVETAELKGDAFKIEYLPMHAASSKSRKRKRTADAGLVQEGLFDDRLDCRYAIKPRDFWYSMRKFLRFTLAHQGGQGQTTVSVGDCVLVVTDSTLTDEESDESELWKAKVLEVRAVDSEHAYLRVAWLNRPEDLDSDRRPWHGHNELIPSNRMDIIAAMAVNGKIKLSRFAKLDSTDVVVDAEAQAAEDEGLTPYYWRQTYDMANGRKLSPLESICIDKLPHNPDEIIVQCPNPACRQWLHSACIASTALHDARQRAGYKAEADSAISQLVERPPRACAASTDGEFTAYVYIVDENNSEAIDEKLEDASSFSEVEILAPDSKASRTRINCLFCGHLID